MKRLESPRINKKSIRGDSGDSWPVWNRGIYQVVLRAAIRAFMLTIFKPQLQYS